MKVLADASLPNIGDAFPPPFALTLYQEDDEIPTLLKNQEILVCRSTLKVNQQLLCGHSPRYIATASSGIDHIDLNYLQANAIQLIDAKGCNANAVADYVIASLAFLQKYKNFRGKKAAVIGVGAVGSEVVARLKTEKWTVICYDPLRNQHDSNFHSSHWEDIVDCDLFCIHASLHDIPPHSSRGLVDDKLLQQLKPGAAIINASRGDIIDEKSLLQGNYNLFYCTDVFSNEPCINKEIVDLATLCTPHIAGHTIEAKYAAVAHISYILHINYSLVPPKLIRPSISRISKPTTSACWQDLVLSLYNPLKETNALKASDDVKTAFQALRAAHNYRHNFC